MTVRPDHRCPPGDPAPWVALVVGVLLAFACLWSSGCGPKPKPREVERSDSRTETAAPGTAEEARQRLAQAEADVSYYRSLADHLAKAERQEQLERICTWVRWLSLLGFFGSTLLHILGWIQPALRPLRALAGMGAAAALGVFALAWVLPTWAPWLAWVAIALTVGGVGLLLYRLIRTGRGLEGAVLVAEGLKDLGHVATLSVDERKQLQKTRAGAGAPAIDEVRAAIGGGIEPRGQA